MNTEQITNLCLSGSKKYYEYLENKGNGGVEEITVHSINSKGKNTFSFKLARKLFAPETIVFRHKNREFTSDEIKVKVYDNKKKVVVVKITSEEIIGLIQSSSPEEWVIIIDLKFLVQRVIDWYEQNGENIKFSFGANSTGLDFDTSLFTEDLDKPSKEQQKAIDNIFKNNYSYIWGAPGTGKTRFVLSYSIINYLKNDKRVLILAPTNVALEQIFRGIIDVTDKVGIERKVMLRMGYPSKKFADDYGEICEIQGIEKQLDFIKIQIQILRGILKIDSAEELERKRKVIELEELKALSEKANSVKKDVDITHDNKNEIKRKISKQNSLINEIRDERTIVFKKKNSFTSKFFSVFISKLNYEEELEVLRNKEHESVTTITQLEDEFVKIDTKISELNDNLKLFISKIKDSVSKIESWLPDLKDNIKNLENFINEIKSKKITDDNDIDEETLKVLYNEYKGYTEMELRTMLSDFERDSMTLTMYSLESRLKEAKIIGATLDTYLYRTMDSPLNVAHIFIDEAGYASIVKALTVFTTNTPVTMLGDHKQLPPVCEISQRDINREPEYKDVFVWDQSAIHIESIWSSENKSTALRDYLLSSQPTYNKINKSSLTQTYRFGANLAKTLSRFVYEDGFSSHLKENTEVVVVKVYNPRDRVDNQKKRLNVTEAEAVAAYVKKYHKETDSFAVLAPYVNQIRHLKYLMPELKDDDRILTVHKSQGQEWDTVLYSVCDIGNGKTPWFTDSTLAISKGLNNVNTAVSRAKNRLVIFCSYNDWIGRNNQLVCGLLNSATEVLDYKGITPNTSTKQK